MAKYTREATPSDTLTSLAAFVVQFYACAWFKTKHANDMAEMPAIYFEAIKTLLALDLTPAGVDVVKSTLERNAFPLLAENMLHSMISSKNPEVASRGAEYIQSIRSR